MAPAHASLAIRWRLTAWITVAFILTLAAILVSLRLALGQILYSDVDSDLRANLDQVNGAMVIGGAADTSRLQGLADSFPFPVVIRDAGGLALAINGSANDSQMALTEVEVVRVTVENRLLDEDEEVRGEAFRVRSGRVQIGVTPYIVQVGRSTQSISDVTRATETILIGGGAIAALLVLIVAYLLARSALRPVEEITHLASDIGASDLTQRIAAEREPAEIQRLADTFDAMLARLESAFAQQRSFVMDVSHELRTPLTALRGNLDVMLMDKGLDPDTRAQLESMSSEVARLIRLTSNLLYLAHAEAGREIARRPVELDALCLEVVYQARALRDDVSVRLDNEVQVTVNGDRDLLKQLVLNLVDNAIKYSPPNTDVTVSLYATGDEVQIVVGDRGPGIPPEQLEQIFERFYRVSGAQSRTVGGAGIGLAISRWIAQAHGGDIRVESDVGAGSRFIVVLPLSRLEQRVPAVP
jgi:heavy metal sensor kinase